MGNGATGSTPGFGPGAWVRTLLPQLTITCPRGPDGPGYAPGTGVGGGSNPALKWVQCQRSHAVLPCR